MSKGFSGAWATCEQGTFSLYHFNGSRDNSTINGHIGEKFKKTIFIELIKENKEKTANFRTALIHEGFHDMYVPSTTVSSKLSPHHSLSKSKSFSVALVLTEKRNHIKQLTNKPCFPMENNQFASCSKGLY